MNNIIIIGKDVEDIGETAWNHNTNYTVVAMTKKLNDVAEKYVDENDLIILADKEELKSFYNESEFINFCEIHDVLPVFISEENDPEDDYVETILKKIPDGVLFKRNEHNVDFDKLDYILTERVLKGRANDNTAIPTSDGRG